MKLKINNAFLCALFLLPYIFWIFFKDNNIGLSNAYYAAVLIFSFIFFNKYLFELPIDIKTNFLNIDDYLYRYLKFFLIILALYGMLSAIYTSEIFIGLPHSHGSDFFQGIYLAVKNNFTEISTIGYLPGILFFIKLISLIFPKINNELYVGVVAWIIYLLIYLFCFCITLKPLLKNQNRNLILIVAFTISCSYPFLLEFERGNLVIFSMVALALVLQNLSGKFNYIYLGLFSSLKILNIIALPIFILLGKYDFIKFFLVVVVFIFALPSLLIILLDVQLDYSSLLVNIIQGGTFPDIHIAIAHSGLYSLLVLYQNSGIFQSLDRVIFIKICVYLLISLLSIYYFFEFYCKFIKKLSFNINDVCFSLIFLFSVTKLLHHNNADMNYVLYFPLIISMCLLKLNKIEGQIFNLTLIFLFPLNSLLLFQVNDPSSPSIYYFTLRSLIFTSALFGIVTLSLIRLYNKVRSI